MLTRFYSPYINRFLQPDSIIPSATNPQSWNRFSYVLNNPIRFKDPTGHACEPGDELPGGYCYSSRRTTPSPGGSGGWRDRGEDEREIVQALDDLDSCEDLECNRHIRSTLFNGFSNWEIEVLRNLTGAGDEGYHAAQYLYAQSVDFDNLTTQFGTGAAWNLDGTISFPNNRPLPAPNYPNALGLIAHEAKHLEQGWFVAPTAYGELEAWQIGMRVTINLGAPNPLGDVGQAINLLPLIDHPGILIPAVLLMEYQQNQPDLIGENYPLGWLLFLTIDYDKYIYVP